MSLFGGDADFDFKMHEKQAYKKGYRLIAGIDEAGRGALAGPVVAAAVILPPEAEVCGIDDSKKLSASKREKVFRHISKTAVAIGIGIGDPCMIDKENILQATLKSMKRAVDSLLVKPDFLLVDGNFSVPTNIHQKIVVRGDSSSISIAAASIVAKVTRDSIMLKNNEIFPGFGFAEHKGYGCKSHMAAIAKLGPCAIHRKTFRGVKEYLAEGFCDVNGLLL